MYQKAARNWFVRLLTLSIILGVCSSAHAASPINTLEKSGLFKYRPSTVAIRGYDTVAYFTLGKPQKGRAEFSHNWNNVDWHFASEDHLALFKGDPARYAPQFGGYCAYGVAEGYLAKIEGSQWTIVDGKLYLNYSKKFNKLWRQQPEVYIEQAKLRFEQLLAN
ncbi:MAG: hypothetical protein KTR32_13270 [Granulosicoccus sp.]|nr:hypothetical protein [Granulosicoccus sp.]